MPGYPGQHRVAQPRPFPSLDRFAFDSAARLLGCLTDQLALTIGGPVCRESLIPGGDPAPMDYCCACDEGMGQATVSIYRVFTTTGRFPQVEFKPRDCTHLLYGLTLEMTVYRCAAVLKDNGDPPDVQHLWHDVAVQADDAAAMRRALRCCFAPDNDTGAGALTVGTDQYVEDDWNPVPPQGGCFGGRMRVLLPVNDTDCSCPPLQQPIGCPPELEPCTPATEPAVVRARPFRA